MTRNPLRICVPVSMSDVLLLEPWVNNFIQFGGAKGHHVDFFPTPQVKQAAVDAARAIQNYAGTVNVHTMDKDFKNGWPKACNEHFFNVVWTLTKMQNQLPWLWMELDTTVRKEGWADDLSNEYVLNGGNSLMGQVCPVRKIVKDAMGHDQLFVDTGDLYVSGVAIYPVNADRIGANSARFAVSQGFDVYMRHYFAKYRKNTDLISTQSGTCNYTDKDGTIFAEDCPNKPFGTNCGGMVSTRSILHHGCKDGSFARLLLEQAGLPYRALNEILAGAPIPAPEPVAAPEPRPVAKMVPVEPVSGSGGIMAAAFQAAKQQMGIESVKPAAEPEKASYTVPSLDAIKEAIRSSPRPARMIDYAAKFGTSIETIKTFLTPENGIRVKQGGWVQLV